MALKQRTLQMQSFNILAAILMCVFIRIHSEQNIKTV